ncbi:hypothetical protein [Vibrio salinus]|uniref:hypothetical protein n=1 Tax=Vibrio salinus TaxID=2899784 RepID=UPI001E54BEB8|nr:hypothetical protein [Vibrio salinus]MCE0494158.1 hypothetical protein [Vibrio salinus]
MHAFAIVAFTLVIRWLIYVVDLKLIKEILIFLGGGLPLILIILGYIDKDIISVTLAAICLFGFPITSNSK